MGHNKDLRSLYESYGFKFNKEDNKDGVCYTVVNMEYYDIFMSTKIFSFASICEIMKMPFSESVIAFRKAELEEENIYSVTNVLDTSMQ